MILEIRASGLGAGHPEPARHGDVGSTAPGCGRTASWLHPHGGTCFLPHVGPEVSPRRHVVTVSVDPWLTLDRKSGLREPHRRLPRSPPSEDSLVAGEEVACGDTACVPASGCARGEGVGKWPAPVCLRQQCRSCMKGERQGSESVFWIQGPEHSLTSCVTLPAKWSL